MRKNKDSHNFINKLSKDASMPDPVFRHQLKQHLLKEFSKQSLADKLFGHLNQLQFGLLSFATSALVIIAIVFVTISLYGGKNTINLGDNLNEQDKTAVMRKIFSVNPDSQVNPQTGLPNTGFKTADIGNSDTGNISENSLYNYKTLTQTYILGDKSTSCKAFTDLPVAAKVISNAAVNSDKTLYYINTLAYDSSNNLLNAYYADNKTQLDYVGGKYAAEFQSPSSIQTNDNKVNISSSSEVKEIIIAGKKYYSILKTEEQSFCTAGLDNIGRQVSSVTQVDADSYRITNIKYYLGGVSDANLIISMDSTFSEAYKAWDDIKSSFTNPVSSITKISEIDSTQPNYKTTLLQKYKLILLLPKTANSNIVSINSPVLTGGNENYYLFDRDYYPAGNKGDNLMLLTLKNSNNSINITYTVNYVDTEDKVKEQEISASISSSTILAAAIDESTNKTVNLEIDGNKVIASYAQSEVDSSYAIRFNLNHIDYSFNYIGDLASLPSFTLQNSNTQQI